MVTILLKLSMRFARAVVLPLTFGPVLAIADPPAASPWEGSVGLILIHSPNYLGAADGRLHARPGLYLRYGRISVTTTGGFVSRRNEAVRAQQASLERVARAPSPAVSPDTSSSRQGASWLSIRGR